MSEPFALQSMHPDERQVLKEAVCDAILERTRRVVSGTGDLGLTVMGSRPSRILSSGFILPRLDEQGDDESNDIRLAAHGLDLRVRPSNGMLKVSVNLAAYVRILPNAEDLFSRNGRYLPKPELSDDAKSRVKSEVDHRLGQLSGDLTGRARRELRNKIAEEVHREMGIVAPDGASMAVAAESATDEVPTPADPPPGDGRPRLRIPNALSRRHEAPAKWRRIDVDAPTLELPLPVSDVQWTQATAAYNARLRSAVRDSCLSFLASQEGQDWAWRKRRPQSEDFWSRDAWERYLQAARADAPVAADVVPHLQVSLLVQAVPDQTAPGCMSIRIALENVQESDATMECGAFNVSLRVELPEAALAPMRLERVKRSYHLAGFMNMPAIGVNGGVDDLGVINGIRHLRTTWMPRYVLPRMQARQIPSVPTAYSRLSSETEDIEALRGLVEEMDRWRAKIAASTNLSLHPDEGDAHDETRQREQFQNDLNAWDAEARRVELGITLLLKSRSAWRNDPLSGAAIPYRAWLLLNKSFDRGNPRRGSEALPGWRLFQLAFILAHIPTLASRLAEYSDFFRADFDEDSASLLYMSTGGGKTEAFFGIVVFGLFLDRLRGKHRGATAMLHYPLRLLTVQQAQRLARLLAHAEMVRRREGVAGAPFELGFWVGSGNTPNQTEKRAGFLSDELIMIPAWNSPRAADEQALRDGRAPGERGYPAAWTSWNKLPTCPFCRSKTPTALRVFPEDHNRLGIVCLNPRCDWNLEHHTSGVVVPLPFLLADSDIYRRAPSILLGTIDKLALIGQNINTIDKIAGMFGMARAVEADCLGGLSTPYGQDIADIEARGLLKVAPAFPGGTEVFFDPFPSLIVQDEMHLLEESLGTFGGIFETGLFAWLRRLSNLLGTRVVRVPGAPDHPRLPHVVGATATVSDAAKHTRSLYQLGVRQFPHPGPALHSTFYSDMSSYGSLGIGADRAATQASMSSPARDREMAAPWGRLHASIMTNGRLHTVTTISVLAAHAATITRWQRDLASADPEARARAVAEIADSVSDAPYAAARKQAVVRAAASGTDALAALVDLHRIELTYVTNKKGGDQILAALGPEAHEAHLSMGERYSLAGFETELISGGVDIGGIQRVIGRAEAQFDPMTDDISGALRVIVATSAISHGVDVEAFNAMAFAGMPSDIAEYIQASSRVGRTHVGFSLLIPTPQNRRDRFVVEVHESFHRLLERMISPPAIERWADKAIARTIPSLVQTWLSGVHFQESFATAASNSKQSVPLPTTVEHLSRALSDPKLLADCLSFIRDAVGVGGHEGQASNPEYYTDLIAQEVQKIELEASSGNFTGRLKDMWDNRLSGLQRPMSSLRDVDAAGTIRSSRYTEQNRLASADEVAAAMTFVRNRSLRGSSSSELDREDM